MRTPQISMKEKFYDCLKRTKKKQNSRCDFRKTTDLFDAIIMQTSILQDKSSRSLRGVGDAVMIFNKFLCGGQWCVRSHCKNHSNSSAWNCTTTRPDVCGDYKKYRKKQILKKFDFFKEGEDAREEYLSICASKRFTPHAGIFFNEKLHAWISYEYTEQSFFIEINKKEVDALEFFFKYDRLFDREVNIKIYNSLKKL